MTAILMALLAACTLTLQASETRTIDGSVAAADLERVVLEVGVGDVEVAVSNDDTVSYEVVLKPRRGGFFSSMKRAEREVREATLESDVAGSALHLQIESDSDEKRFEERWTLEMPARLALELELGVGDVEIRGIDGGVEVEAGVSDLLVEVGSGSVSIEAGVGEVSVRAPADAYGDVECSSGVGDARIRIRGDRIEGEGFVGHACEWSGDGPHEILIEVGVGDTKVVLD